MKLPAFAIQAAQIFTVAFLSPLLTGVIARAEAVVAGKRGPTIFQPYRDIVKYLHKQRIKPSPSSWIFCVAPYVACGCYVTVATLIPVLTTFPLPGAPTATSWVEHSFSLLPAS